MYLNALNFKEGRIVHYHLESLGYEVCKHFYNPSHVISHKIEDVTCFPPSFHHFPYSRTCSGVFLPLLTLYSIGMKQLWQIFTPEPFINLFRSDFPGFRPYLCKNFPFEFVIEESRILLYSLFTSDGIIY